MMLKDISVYVVHGFEIAGISAIVIGCAMATVLFVRSAASQSEAAYRLYRQRLGQAILLGLELLVAADIINTVAGVVLIRTFLSSSLEVESEGRWPWARPASAKWAE